MTEKSSAYNKDKTPWGQKPVPGIPVPPFASREEGEKFFRMLGLYIALLDGPGSPVQPSTYAVVTLLEAGRNALRGVKEWPAPLDPAVLYLALTVFFPVPWTPHGLAAAMSAAPWDKYQDWGLDSPDIISWGYDPRFVARRLEGGSWTVIKHDRGNESVLGTPRDDDEMVLLLTGRQRTHAYPFAWSTDPSWIRSLRKRQRRSGPHGPGTVNCPTSRCSTVSAVRPCRLPDLSGCQGTPQPGVRG